MMRTVAHAASDADQIKLSFARLKAAELGASLPRAGRSVVRIRQERFGPALKHVKMALAR